MKAEVKRSPVAQAWVDWLASEDGQGCARFSTLQAAKYPSQYLENRLWRAFMAGVKARGPKARKVKKARAR